MRNPFRPDAVLEALVLQQGQTIAEMRVKMEDCERRLEEFRIRLSAPKDEVPITYRGSGWLDQRRELESRYAQEREHAKQSNMA